uniref:Uncharacterized protein n=1 Tax=Cannabis sativa TaxID=3483 RepID=A0A803QQX2_CANSA
MAPEAKNPLRPLPSLLLSSSCGIPRKPMPKNPMSPLPSSLLSLIPHAVWPRIAPGEHRRASQSLLSSLSIFKATADPAASSLRPLHRSRPQSLSLSSFCWVSTRRENEFGYCSSVVVQVKGRRERPYRWSRRIQDFFVYISV